MDAIIGTVKKRKECFLWLIILFIISINYQDIAFSGERSIEIRTENIIKDLVGQTQEFPKYTTQIMNLANQNAQGTRPRHVGQMSDLIQEFPGNTYEEWVDWYQKKNPHAIDAAAQKIFQMICNMKKAMELIDEPMVRRWVEDLVLTKTYAGLRFQEAVIRTLANMKGETSRLATAEEEAKGIDGFIGKMPVAVSPVSYKSKNMLNEKSEVKTVYYKKVRNGIVVYYDF